MIALGLCPVVVSLLVGFGAGRLARALSGRVAAILLTVVGLVCALSVGLVLSAVGCLALAQWTPFALHNHWSPALVAARDPIPDWMEPSSGVLAIALLACAAVRFALTLREIASQVALGRRLAGDADHLVVVDDAEADAFVLAGVPGRTVVTRPMLRALSGPERQALLAHEASHLRNYHFVYVMLTQLAAAANPLLRPLVPGVHLSVERWADEDAAREVDRNVVMTALARAGLARGAARPVPRGALAAAASELSVRLDALGAPRASSTRRGRLVAGALALAAAGCVVTSATVGLHLHDLVEWAQTVAARRGT